MGFLDRIAANKSAEGVGEKKPNPLAARKNPLAARKPSVPLKPVLKDKEAVATSPVEEIVETTEEAVATTETVVEAVQETPAPVVEAKATEEASTSETNETIETAPVSTEEAEPAATEDEDKQKAKVKNNRRKTKSVASTETDELPAFYEMPTTQMDYAEAVEAIRSPFVDETWQAFKDEVIKDLESVQISEDMNTGTLKVVSTELSILRDKIFYALYEAKTDFERYSSKEPEGLIERVKRINCVGGNNDTERRRNGILACVNYETPVGPVNLYELMDEARARYSFLRAIDESIKFKKDVLITMNGALKLEKDLL